MNLKDIKRDDVLAGGNWLLGSGDDPDNPSVRETIGFDADQTGLFSAVVKFADDSVHASIVVRSFPHDGEDLEVSDPIYVLNFLFSGGPPPIGSYPDCDTAAPDDDCAESTCKP